MMWVFFGSELIGLFLFRSRFDAGFFLSLAFAVFHLDGTSFSAFAHFLSSFR